MECPEKDARAEHDERSNPDERSGHDEHSIQYKPFLPIQQAHSRFLDIVHDAPAAVDPDFMRAILKSIHEIFPYGPLTEDEYFRLPTVMNILYDLKCAVEMNFPANGRLPYSGPLIPKCEVIHALRLGHPYGELPDVVSYSLMVLQQEHLLELPLDPKRSRSASSVEDPSRVASSPALKKPRYDEAQGHTMAMGLAGSIDADKPATLSKEQAPPRSLVSDSSASTIVHSKERDSKLSETRESSIVSTRRRTRRSSGRRRSGRRRESPRSNTRKSVDRAYPDRAYPDRRV